MRIKYTCASVPGASVPARTAPFATPPQSEITGIWVDVEGLVWVVAWAPAEDWAPRPSADRTIDLADLHDLYDTIVEIIDPRESQVVVRRRLSGRVLFTRTPPWTYRVEYGEDGDLLYAMMALELIGP